MHGSWLIALELTLPAAQWAVAITCLALAILCAHAASRREINSSCALALGFALLAPVAQVLRLELCRRGSPGVPAAVASGLYWAMIGCLGMAFVLSVLGFAEIASPRQRGVGGKGLGGLALVLSTAALTLVWLARDPLIREARGESRAAGRVERQSPPGVQLVIFHPLNFRYRPPGRPWEIAEAAQVNPESCFALQLAEPRLFFAIIAPPAAAGEAGDNEDLARSVELNVRSFLPDATVLEERPLAVGKLQGRRLRVRGTIQGVSMTYEFWVHAGGGHRYQLVAWGETEHEPRLIRDFDGLIAGFELIDDSPAAAPARPQVDDGTFRSSRYGYTMKLPRSWRNWTRVRQEVPEAESGGRFGRDVALAVIPLRLLGTKPHPEMLVQAFFSAYHFEYSTENLARREPVRVGEVHGSAFSLEREDEGQRFRYRLRILQGDDCAYFVCAWVRARDRHGPNLLEKAVASVEFQPPEPLADPGALGGAERGRHASFFNELGLAYYRVQQYARSEEYFRLAHAVDASEAVYVKNAVEALVRNDDYERALKLIEENLDRFASLDLRAQRAWIQCELSRTEPGLKGFAELFDGGYRDDDYFSYYISKLQEAGRLDEAVTRVSSYAGDREHLDLRILEARLLGRQGKFAEAIELLERARENAPHHPGLRRELVELLRAAGRPRDALAIVDDMVEDGFDAARTLYLKATLEYDLRWYSRAKASLEAALQRAPMNQEARSFLDHVSGILGEGTNSLIKTEIEPVAWPEALEAGEEPRASPAAAGAVYLWRVTALRFRPGEEFLSSDYRRVAILDDRGARQFSTIEVDFDPLSEQIHVNRLEVLDASGKTVARGHPGSYFVQDSASGPIVSQSKTLGIPVPGLKAGYQIEFVVTRRRSSPPGRFPFTRHTLSSQFPVRRAALFVDASGESDLQVSAPAGVSRRELAGGTLWEIRDPPPYVWEPYQVEVASFLPTLYLGSSERSWKSVATDYLDTIGDRLLPSAATRELARQLVKDAPSREERIRILARHVQDNLTYKAIEFGRRAIIMDETPTILANRYGDCKDHSLVLMQLLRSAGIEARLALVNSDGPIIRELPSLGQFDHMVVYVEGEASGGEESEPRRCIDTTDKDSDPALPTPYGLAGKSALVLDPRRPRFVELPPYPEGSSRVQIERELELGERAGVRIVERVRFRGYYASFMRSYLKGHDPDRRKQAVQELLAASGFQVLVKKLTLSNLRENGEPLVLELECETENAFHAAGEVLTGKFPSLWAAYYLAPSRVEQRRTPFRILFPVDFSCRTELALPPGYRARPQDLQTSGLESDFGRLELRLTAAGGRVLVELDFQLRAGRHPPSRYAEFMRMNDEGRRLACPVLTFERAADAEPPSGPTD